MATICLGRTTLAFSSEVDARFAEENASKHEELEHDPIPLEWVISSAPAIRRGAVICKDVQRPEQTRSRVLS
jgi:hypothetical protein